MVDFLQDAKGRFVHASDLLESTPEKVGQIFVPDGVQVALIVVDTIELIFPLAIFPVLTILQQHDDFAVIESHSLNVGVDLDLHNLLPVIEQVLDQKRMATLDSNNSGALLIDGLAVKLNLLGWGPHAVQVPLDDVTS